MAPIGKAMLHRTYQQMAHKMWQYKALRVELVKYVLRAVAAEWSELCSTKKPFMAGRSSSEDVLKFDPQSLGEEWKEKAAFSILFLCLLPCRGDEKM